MHLSPVNQPSDLLSTVRMALSISLALLVYTFTSCAADVKSSNRDIYIYVSSEMVT
jgi:hypothetical protein